MSFDPNSGVPAEWPGDEIDELGENPFDVMYDEGVPQLPKVFEELYYEDRCDAQTVLLNNIIGGTVSFTQSIKGSVCEFVPPQVVTPGEEMKPVAFHIKYGSQPEVLDATLAVAVQYANQLTEWAAQAKAYLESYRAYMTARDAWLDDHPQARDNALEALFGDGEGLAGPGQYL